MDVRSAWTPRNIYLYLVCLITLVITIFALTNVVRSTVELAYPEPAPAIVPAVPEGAPNGDAEQREQQAEYLRRSSRRRAVIGLVGNGALLAVAVPLYLYHWRAIGREGR